MQNKPIRRIAVSTGGGDAPGLNAVIRSVVLSALRLGWECYGIRDGFNGILSPQRYAQGGLIRLERENVRGIGNLGGTILGTTNAGNPLKFPVVMPDGSVQEQDRSDEILSFFRQHQLDALITIGGDGSLTIANALHQRGLAVIGVPKTIDNDLDKTNTTFGFDTAVDFATECIDRLHNTAQSHHRVIVVEVMGRYAGWIALHAGIAGDAHCILIPEIAVDIDRVVEKIVERETYGRLYSIVVVAEGAVIRGTEHSLLARAEAGGVERLGGMGERIAKLLHEKTGKDTRTVVLGHLLRGGTPTAFDRLAATRFGTAAVRALAAGKSGVMVALAFPNVNYVPLDQVAGRMKAVPLDGDTILAGRNIGICFGD